MAVIPSGMISSRVQSLIRTCITLLSWYCISTSIILILKWLFNSHFPFPLTCTTYANTLTSVWALLCSRRPVWRPEPLTRRQFREYVLPIGVATALEIGLSNIALKILTVSFGTILKGGAPVFTMIWGLLLGVETFSANLCLSLLTIALGIALASFGEGQAFVLTGFILQLAATALGGLRWAMTHVLLRGDANHRMPPLTATLYTSPTTAACVFPFALFLEGGEVWEKLSAADGREWGIIGGSLSVVATLVFILLISEYWLVNATSSLALSVAGVFKELLTILGGLVVFSEHVTFFNVVGFLVCQVGIGAYIWLRYDPDDMHDTHDGTESQLPLTYVISDDVESEDDDGIELREDYVTVAAGK